MKKNLIDYSILEQKKIQMNKKLNDMELLKQKLEEHFKFNIPTYIIADIIENEDYRHFCLMINVAVINSKLTEKQGIILKDGIKKMLQIKNEYTKLTINNLLI